MATHPIALLLRVSAQVYADAARQRRAGNPDASPLALARIAQDAYVLSNYNAERITLLDTATGRHYWGAMPAVLVDYLAGFRRGVRVLEDHEFDLVLASHD